MTEANPISGDGAGSLAGRPPAYELMCRVLAEHERSSPRTGLQRFLGVNPLNPDGRSWFTGAIGEKEVSRLLARLGQEWTVLNSVPVGKDGSDIDHIVIGPPGVFTINTKHHRRGKIWLSPKLLMVNGQKTDHLRNARHESTRASTLLSVAVGAQITVRSIIALVGDPNLTVRGMPDDVLVVDARGLAKKLRRMKPVFTPELLAVIRAAAEKPATWSTVALTSVDPATLSAFASLQKEVNSAHTRRVLVGMLGGVAIIAATIWLALWIIGQLQAYLIADSPGEPTALWTPVIIIGVFALGLSAVFPKKKR
jgi:hypothetical protein